MNRRAKIAVVIALASLGAAAVAAALSHDESRWRVQVLTSMARGQLDGIGWVELVSMILPGSGFDLDELARNPNPFAVIRNPYQSADDRESGRRVFLEKCSPCHGADAAGGDNAPNLKTSRLKMGDADWALFQSVSGDAEGLTMPPVPLSDEEAWQVIGYVKELRESAATESTVPSDTPARIPDNFNVPGSRLIAAEFEPENWLTYSGSYWSWRYSTLDEIDVKTAADLKLAWSLQLDTDEAVKATPIVVDGIMFMTEPPSSVLAVDAANGETIWRYDRRISPNVPNCCGRVNRGVAVLDDRVFINTLDGYLEALDARTGNLVWSTRVADYRDGYSMTSAPLAVMDTIIVGVAGGEFGIRGFLDAYDASTGDRRWRFYTIPAPGEPGSESWQNDAWRTGGGPTWVTGSVDLKLGLVYWGVGNPGPDFNGDVRPGDNLYTDSVIALDLSSGELVWHFQFTPHDEHDWDSNQIPVLVDRELDGQIRQLMLWANRNGFFYVLDRATGEFLNAAPFVKQTWAQGIDENGRPVLAPNSSPAPRGTLTWPGTGATNWWSPSYSPSTDLLYVPVAEFPRVFFKQIQPGRPRQPGRGGEFMGSTMSFTGQPLQMGVRALDPDTGQVQWEHLSQPRRDFSYTGGVLSTAGSVIFKGDKTYFSIFDARNGTELWRTNLGGIINATPITYAVDDHQMVAIPSGDTVYVFRL